MLGPKETYRCFVLDPNKKNDELSAGANTSQWQVEMAQNFDFGREGFVSDQIEALNWYTKAAEQGHGLAQVTLGVKYASGGTGFVKDVIRSARWFLIAAQQNYDTAQYAIANCFLQGSGVQQNLEKAYYWFQQSADKGIDEARYKMANMLLEGYGTDEEVDALMGWFSFFADENRSDAQYMYSKLLLARKASPENEINAIEYLNKAIALSNVDAMSFLAERCFNKELNQYNVIKGMELLRLAVELNSMEAKTLMDKYTKSLSREEVYTYTKHFADSGNAVDMADLGNMYYIGDGTEVNYEKAVEYFTKSSEYEIEDSFIGLGLCYYYGFGVKFDYDKAFDNLSKGIAGGKSVAVSTLGLCYYYGYGVEKDHSKAFELFTKANDGKSGTALNGLGLCYCYGLAVEKNTTKAVALFTEALKKDQYNAGLNLGDYYRYDSIPDMTKAVEYYTIAAKVENPEAQNKLGFITFNQGIKKIPRVISKNIVDTLYAVSNEEVVAEALSMFKKSAKRNYLKGEYNYAYGLISTLNDDTIVGSTGGKESVTAFRDLADKGCKDAMIALASYYKYNIGIDLAESYEWSKKAAQGGSGDEARDAMYKGLLGCLEYDEAEAIATIIDSSAEQVRSQGIATMTEAEAAGCTFVYSRLYTYEKDITKDKKAAKIWDKKSDLVSERDKLMPKITEFKL